MIKKNADGIYISTVLSQWNQYVHGFSTRQFGDVRKKRNQQLFFAHASVSHDSLVWPQQIHKDSIHSVSLHDRGKEIPHVDGLIYINTRHAARNPVTIGVHAGDCVPLLFIEPAHSIIGTAHAGWRGTVLGIASKMVECIRTLGGKAEYTHVAIGPHIGPCCYDVPKERAFVFTQEFGHSPSLMCKRDSRYFLDIGYAVYIDLLKSGIPDGNIDRKPLLCTSCLAEDFFSFRNKKHTFGEFLGIVGIQ